MAKKSNHDSRVFGGKRFFLYQTCETKEQARELARRLRRIDPKFYKGKSFRIVEHDRWRYYGFPLDENRNKPKKKIYGLYIGPRRVE